MTDEQKLAPVTKADIDAADALREQMHDGDWGLNALASDWRSDHPILQMIARHRIASPSSTTEPGMVEAVAQFLHDEGGFDEAWHATWPEHPDDTGQREGGFVRIVPSDVQAKFRDVARRLCARYPTAIPPSLRADGDEKDNIGNTDAITPSLRSQQAEVVALREALRKTTDALVRHHQWHAAQTDPDPEHGFIPADEYADSTMYDQTVEALSSANQLLADGPVNQAADALASMGGGNG